MQKMEDHDIGGAGEVVFYAHGSDSMRTYIGISKLHSRAECSPLVRRAGTVVRDRIAGVTASQRCRLCHPELVERRRQLPDVQW
jgi:hypothetical protein